MGIKEVRHEVSDEVRTILGGEFDIEVTATNVVPHAGDPAITFPNLSEGYQRCKVIETAVLYIDLRRSTLLNLEHRPKTVAKLYSAFVRSMTACADHFNGHVRGIIGDRLMVLFNPSTAFHDAVNTAILMNSVAQFVLNEHFERSNVTCGIGIDYGRMLVTKTGVRRHGVEQPNYRSLVWLGRPANVASKLTDIANKTTSRARDVVREGHYYPAIDEWVWLDINLKSFLEKLEGTFSRTLVHKDPFFRSFFLNKKHWERSTPPILMTEPILAGYKRASPDANSVKRGWWEPVSVSVPGYDGKVFGGDVHFIAFSPEFLAA